MKISRSICIALSFLLLFSGTAFLFPGCAGEPEDPRDVVYEDMKENLEKSGILSANIGLFSKTEKDGSITYGEGGSGVIFKKEGTTYYALTAAHVVSVEGAELLVYTVNTEMKSEEIPGIDMNVLAQETYEAMYKAEIVRTSTRDDLAIIRFTAEEDLSVATLADSDPKIDDRIMCIGNPNNEWFVVSYGKVTSGMEKFGEAQGFPSNVMKHSAYIHVGSSGGGVFNEQMQLIGTVTGGGMSLMRDSFEFGALIPASEIRLFLEEE